MCVCVCVRAYICIWNVCVPDKAAKGRILLCPAVVHHVSEKRPSSELSRSQRRVIGTEPREGGGTRKNKEIKSNHHDDAYVALFYSTEAKHRKKMNCNPG